MKLLAALIITASLILGAIVSVTAYLPKVDNIDPEDEVTLMSPAGVDPDDPHTPLIDPAGEELTLTAERLDTLQEAGVKRVRVKEFSFGRWDFWWLFMLAALGLFAGAMMMRQAARKELRQQQAADGAEVISPSELLNAALDRLKKLKQDVDREPDRLASMKRMIHTIDDIHDEQLDPFVRAKSELIARYGMTGYAQLMDAFAASERLVNRAWSASADEVYDEAVECLDEANVRMEAAIRQLEELTVRADTGAMAQPLTPEPSSDQQPIEGDPPRGHDHDRPLS